MQSGELFVSGKSKAEIELRSHPDKVEVKFLGHPTIIPCNHHHEDSLQWEVIKKHFSHHGSRRSHVKYFLVLSWYVNEPRKIFWEVLY